MDERYYQGFCEVLLDCANRKVRTKGHVVFDGGPQDGELRLGRVMAVCPDEADARAIVAALAQFGAGDAAA